MKYADLKGTQYECVDSIYLTQERGQVTSSSEHPNVFSDCIKCRELVDYCGDTTFLRSILLHVAVIRVVHNFLSQVSPAEGNFVTEPFLAYSINEIRILDFYIPTSFYKTNVTKKVEN